MDGSERFMIVHFKLIADSKMVKLDCSRYCGVVFSIEYTVSDMIVIKKLIKNPFIMKKPGRLAALSIFFKFNLMFKQD